MKPYRHRQVPSPLLRVLAVAMSVALQYSAIGEPLVSPEFFVQKEKVDRLENGIIDNAVRVSPDGRRIAQLVIREGKRFVFVDGEQSPEYQGLVKNSLRFSPDSKRFGYGAVRDGRRIVVIDGKEYSAYDGSAEGHPIFSPDSKRFAFFAKQGEKIAAVVDGVMWPAFDSVIKENLTFSTDSQRVAYVAKDGDYARVVIDGIAGSKFRNIVAFQFSPDGKHYVYIGISLSSMVLVVDGAEAVTAEAFVKDTLAFDDPTRLHILALKQDEVIRVQLDLVARATSGR